MHAMHLEQYSLPFMSTVVHKHSRLKVTLHDSETPLQMKIRSCTIQYMCTCTTKGFKLTFFLRHEPLGGLATLSGVHTLGAGFDDCSTENSCVHFPFRYSSSFLCMSSLLPKIKIPRTTEQRTTKFFVEIYTLLLISAFLTLSF